MGVLSLVAPRVGALIGIYQKHREALEGSLAAGVLLSLCAFSLSVALAGSTLSFQGFFKDSRRERNSLATLARTLLISPLLPIPPRAPGWERSRALSIWEGGRERGEGACLRLSENEKTHPSRGGSVFI